MGEVGAAAALLLAALFAWAGARKAVRPDTTAASFRAVGIPAPAIAARLLPLAELAIAALLVLFPRVGASLAIAALVVFSVVVARAIARGVEVGCGCFGGSATDPVSAADLVRNGFLTVGALLAAGAPRAGFPSLAAAAFVGGGALTAALLLSLLRVRSHVGSAFPREPSGARP